MKKLLLIIGMILAITFSYSQNITTNYTLQDEQLGVQIYVKKQQCNDQMNGIFQEIGILKFVNTTDIIFKVSFDLNLWYNDSCYTCDNDEYSYDIYLYKGELLEGCCFDENCKVLTFFIRFLNYEDKPVLTKYEVTNLKIEPL